MRHALILAAIALAGCGDKSASEAAAPSEEEMIQQSQQDQKDAAKGKKLPSY